MNAREHELAIQLSEEHVLPREGYATLISNRDDELAALLAELAVKERWRFYGNGVFTRGLIEFTNHCRNDCLYCGIRASNRECERYRLDGETILACCDEGHELGFRTFVLQGGEDPFYDDERMCRLISSIKEAHPDCAVTLSIGERPRESYERLYDAGADRYLLRHETASRSHYARIHPASMSYDNRMRCLHDLKDIGFQAGAGFMVGSPFQTPEDLATDLEFISLFKPDMCGIGPFVPHHATEYADMEGGTVELTCLLLSMIRLIHPPVNLPATTALGIIDRFGREKGILAGANVVMPNLSPVEVREKYELYDNKICSGDEAAECCGSLQARMERIGYRLLVDRGDVRTEPIEMIVE